MFHCKVQTIQETVEMFRDSTLLMKRTMPTFSPHLASELVLYVDTSEYLWYMQYLSQEHIRCRLVQSQKSYTSASGFWRNQDSPTSVQDHPQSSLSWIEPGNSILRPPCSIVHSRLQVLVLGPISLSGDLQKQFWILEYEWEELLAHVVLLKIITNFKLHSWKQRNDSTPRSRD